VPRKSSWPNKTSKTLGGSARSIPHGILYSSLYSGTFRSPYSSPYSIPYSSPYSIPIAHQAGEDDSKFWRAQNESHWPAPPASTSYNVSVQRRLPFHLCHQPLQSRLLDPLLSQHPPMHIVDLRL
jgi:hypothetical protein